MHSEMEAVVDKIVAAGGKQRMLIAAKNPVAWSMSKTRLVFEIYSLNYELTYLAGAH